MNPWLALAIGALQGLTAAIGVLLAIFVGLSVGLGVWKLRPSGRGTRTVRALEERTGQSVTYLPADTPRGRIDVLRTPELLEAAARRAL